MCIRDRALVSRTVVKLLVEQSRFSTRLIYIDHRQLVLGLESLTARWCYGYLRVTRALSYETSIIWNDSVDAIRFFKRFTCLFHFSINILAVNASTTTKNFLSLWEQWSTVKQEDDFLYLVLS